MSSLTRNRFQRGNPYLWGRVPESQSTFTTQEVAVLFDLSGGKSLAALVHAAKFPPADIKGSRGGEGNSSLWTRETLEKERIRRAEIIKLLEETEEKLKTLTLENYYV